MRQKRSTGRQRQMNVPGQFQLAVAAHGSRAGTNGQVQRAEAVLRDQGLRDIKSDATNIDGKVSGKKADGTKVVLKIDADFNVTATEEGRGG